MAATKDKKKKKSSKMEVVEKPEVVVAEAAKSPEPEQQPKSDDDVPAESTPAALSAKRKAFDEEEAIEVDVTAPEPPSSKRARRALKKGKALPAKQDSDDDGTGEKGEQKASAPARSEHGVWIGNLPFTVTPVEMRKWLVDNSGESITDDMITRIKLPSTKDKTKPGNKGFAYVDFNDIGPKVAAIALSETELGGRKLLIKDSRSFEGRPKKEEPAAVGGEGAGDGKKESAVDPNASRKIFVGNMGFKTTDEDIRRQFEKCGEIEWVKVATFEDSGKCKGYGWVKFKEPDAAAWAVKGFVKIKEAVETEDDFKEDADESDAEDDAPPQQQQKQFKTRKWWVNRLLGRELKIELAEDDQTRYKKRFRKDPSDQKADAPRARGPRRTDNEGAAAAPGGVKPLKEAEDIQVARLTGAVVKHTGTKMTFD